MATNEEILEKFFEDRPLELEEEDCEIVYELMQKAREDAIKDYTTEELEVLWKEYALCPDDKLTKDAQEIKYALLDFVKRRTNEKEAEKDGKESQR